jgi:glycerate 2-kinase
VPDFQVPDIQGADVLTDLFWSAVRAVSPQRAVSAALGRLKLDRGTPVWIIALGKAANQMAIAAVDHLASERREPIGGIVIVPRAVPPPHPAMAMSVGDHPVPGAQSLASAEALGKVLAQVAPGDEVWVLLSGGASSLAAASEGPIREEELAELFRVLLRSGVDILTMNAIRKRFLRWGAGRLALAVDGARIRNLVISDVVGDDLSAVASGPCVPDPTTAAEVRLLLEEHGLWEQVPLAVRRTLLNVERDPTLETPKPGDERFFRTERRIIASNRHAVDAAAARARELGLDVRVIGTPVTGEASAAGRRIALQLLGESRREGDRTRCIIWGGESTVTIPAGNNISGGRCQELALAAARELHERGAPPGVALLAAQTDGRDGDTDAAGAVVDATSWERIASSGRDPGSDLANHASHDALDAAGALLRTDLTGTNVSDVMIGICTKQGAG